MRAAQNSKTEMQQKDTTQPKINNIQLDTGLWDNLGLGFGSKSCIDP